VRVHQGAVYPLPLAKQRNCGSRADSADSWVVSLAPRGLLFRSAIPRPISSVKRRLILVLRISADPKLTWTAIEVPQRSSLPPALPSFGAGPAAPSRFRTFQVCPKKGCLHSYARQNAARGNRHAVRNRNAVSIRTRCQTIYSSTNPSLSTQRIGGSCGRREAYRQHLRKRHSARKPREKTSFIPRPVDCRWGRPAPRLEQLRVFELVGALFSPAPAARIFGFRQRRGIYRWDEHKRIRRVRGGCASKT